MQTLVVHPMNISSHTFHTCIYIFTRRMICIAGSKLLPDYFLDVDEDLLDMVKEATKEEAAKSEETKISKMTALFQDVHKIITEDMVKKMQASYLFDVDGERWMIDLKSGRGSVNRVDGNAKADVTLSMTEDVMVAIFTGKQRAMTAYMTGKMKIKGELGKAVKLEKLLPIIQKHSKL